MSNTLYMMVTITERSRLQSFMRFYNDRGITPQFVSLAFGTASSETLRCLGLEQSDKCILTNLVTDAKWLELRHDLRRDLRIDVPGTGIAFIVPLSSIDGKRTLQFLTENQAFEKGAESTMKDTDHELLLVIANYGYNEQIMEAARAAGATGGTVIHAKGAGMEGAEKFFGISLASDKEMIFIVVRSELRRAIMSAIMQHAGIDTKACAICFSLPVTDTAGLRLLEEE